MTYAGDITPQQAWDELAANPEAVLIDVRTQGEWDEIGIPDTSGIGHTPVFAEWVQAGGVPNPAFLQQIAAAGVTPGSNRPLIFLCRSGQRSIAAANAATASGFGPAYNVLEGFEGGVGPQGTRNVSGWKLSLPWTTR